MAPLVSVVMCTYKRAHLLQRSVRSVIAQDWRPLELVLTNDGSPDDTVRVMEDLAAECRAANVIANFATQENGGVSRARNAGLRRLTGEFIGFLDDDDVWLPQKTSRQMLELQKTGADACSALAVETRIDGEHTIPAPPETLFEGFNPASYLLGKADSNLNAMLITRRAQLRAGEFDSSLIINEDLEWKMRLVHEAAFCALNEVVMHISFTPQSLSRFSGYKGLVRRDELKEAALLRIRERCSARNGFDESAWRKRAAKAYDQYVKHRLYGGELARARELWKRGMELTGGLEPLPRLKRKLLKARLLSWIGSRLKHPNLRNIEEFAE